MIDRDIRDLNETVGFLAATLDEVNATKADRWQHTYQPSLALPHVFGEYIDPDDGHTFIGPWEPIGCAVDPHRQVQGEIVPTLVTLWRRPLRKVTS